MLREFARNVMDKPVTDQVLYKHMYNTAHVKSDFQDEVAAYV